MARGESKEVEYEARVVEKVLHQGAHPVDEDREVDHRLVEGEVEEDWVTGVLLPMRLHLPVVLRGGDWDHFGRFLLFGRAGVRRRACTISRLC
jgi:hypothetical protein